MSMRDHIIQWAREREPVSINEIAEHVQILFDKQAAAAKRGMYAAKAYGSHMEAEAKRLHAECNPEALESERQANAEMTEELESLRSKLDALAAFRSAVCGWREADWPEGFCRRTAELLAEHGRQAEEVSDG